MKKLVVVFCFFLSLSIISLGQSKISLGFNGSVIIPKSGETGIGSNIAFVYNVTEQFSIHPRMGILSWGNEYANNLYIFSIASRYYLSTQNIKPYLSAGLDYALGRIKFMNGRYDLVENKVYQFEDELKINEFMSRVGLGMIYPLTKKTILDVNYTLILTVKTGSLYHMRGSIGILYQM